MKKIIYCCTLVLASSTLYSMEIDTAQTKNKNNYPAHIGYMAEEDVLSELVIPTEVKHEIDALVKADQTIKQRCSISSALNINSLKAIAQQDQQRGTLIRITPTRKYVTWVPSLMNHVRSNLSSLGYDPYNAPEINNPAIVTQALNFQPTVQNLTKAIAQRLLAQLNNKTVKSVQSWVYPLYEEKKPLDDRYYLPVYEAVSEVDYKFLPHCSQNEVEAFFENVNLADFQKAIQYISFAFPDEEHLLVNPKDYTVVIIDPQSPNNEGMGDQCKSGKAILGNDLNKAQFNNDNWYDGGRRTFENVLKGCCSKRVDEWNALYKKEESSIK